METLLTLSVGEYSSVEIVLHLAVALLGMTSALLVLTATSLPSALRFPLFISGIALGGAAWFESTVWRSWQEAFELAGTSYCVTGHPIADEYRIIAWSIGAPAILFSFLLTNESKRGFAQATPFFLLALAAPFSSAVALALLLLVGLVLLKSSVMRTETTLAFLSILIGTIVADSHAWHPFSLGGGPAGELVRAGILHTVTDILSLFVPALLLLVGTLRLAKVDQQ